MINTNRSIMYILQVNDDKKDKMIQVKNNFHSAQE